MRYTNNHDLPSPVVAALTRGDSQSVEGLRITTLIDSPRISQLKKAHRDELVEDVADLAYRALGSAVHLMFEQASSSNSGISEERLNAEVEGTLISGAIDYQYEDGGAVAITDYKTTSVFAVMMGDKPEWERQLNCYAMLIRKSKNLPVKRLSIVAILRDWRASESERRGDYPSTPIVSIPIALWPDEEQDRYVSERVRLHNLAETEMELGSLRPCTDEERWARPAKWAVHKGNNKRAMRLFDSEEEANLFKKNGEDRRVIKRAASYLRCEKYCPVAAWCDQNQRGDL